LVGIDAQPSAIPEKNLGLLAILADEQKHVSGKHVAFERLGHQCVQAVETAPHVGGYDMREHGDLPRGADHESLRSSAATPSRSRPSMLKPRGARTMIRVGSVESVVITTGAKPGEVSSVIAQLNSDCGASPSSRAAPVKEAPSASRDLA
jgi:hypothetical protein